MMNVRVALIAVMIFAGFASYDCLAQKAIADGKRLAKTYCQSCHVQPSPEDLDKTTWVAKVFPMMRRYMGLDPLPQHDVLPHDLKALYPTSPMMTEDEWFTVAQWYIDNAPTTLEPPPSVNVRGVTSAFTHVPVKRLGTIPMTTFATYDATSSSILLGDALSNALYVVDAQGSITNTVPVGGPPSHVALRGRKWYVTSMGKLLPHDSAVGALIEIAWSADTPGTSTTKTLIDSLRRPTHVLVEDLNGDGRDDFLICEFGNLIGQFGWYEVSDDGRTKYHQLSPLPGAIRAVIHDMNGDRRPDILVQMAQSRESIVLYTNTGGGKFSSREILSFPPSRGSSSFRLVNADSDPAMEILYTAGDNGDYDLPPYKPYHGVYIFDQTPSGWKQTMFQRLDGAYGAWLADFSGDGKDDLFSFSYFPRFDRGDYDLVRFDQDVFTTSNTSWRVSGASLGRWLVSDVADVDNDGDLDVVLGNVSIGPGIVPDDQAVTWTSSGVIAVILRNTTR
jgi:hypothetical protein